MAKIKVKTLGKGAPLKLTQDQYERLRNGGLTTGNGSPQETYRRILAQVRTTTGEPIAHTTPRELEGLRKCAQRDGEGGWQDWSREVLTANGVAW